MSKLEILSRDLPDPEAAKRFFDQFSRADQGQADRLLKNSGLLSDVLALASYSPLLAASLIQNPEHVPWLGKERSDPSVRSKEVLLESLARFAMMNSRLEPHVLFARFRRRELMRIFLKDIRRLGTVAEITEEVSNLADAILESALRIARQETDNRFGPPFQTDGKGRKQPSDVCIVALGKLGSKELNYSSDIDLVFVYSAEGSTSGSGTKGTVTNREYFVKLAESVIALIGRQTGEGAAYRVDLRLRPHGRVGPLARSLQDTVRYYLNDARGWEQQVLIRSRASAGDPALFKEFFSRVEDVVFRPGRDVEQALEEVFLSKQRIDMNKRNRDGLDVKLDPGGIREIEFIAQALQLAHGGADRWLRTPHSLISISRLADRGLLFDTERSELSNAYTFLRRLEHLLQMEHGLQTHSLPTDQAKLDMVARRMHCPSTEDLRAELAMHMGNVKAAFQRIFKSSARTDASIAAKTDTAKAHTSGQAEEKPVLSKLSGPKRRPAPNTDSDDLRMVAEFSPRFAEFIVSRPWLAMGDKLPEPEIDNIAAVFGETLTHCSNPSERLRELRRTWSRLIVSIVVQDVKQLIRHNEVRSRLTALAESSVAAAVKAAAEECEWRFSGVRFDPAILGLGKLGSGTLDYDSDLDVVVVYDESASAAPVGEVYARGVESLLNLLSSITRDGHLYRMDLRLRPHGKSGPPAVSAEKLAEYLGRNAAVWELLAYVQLRALAHSNRPLEARLHRVIRDKAASLDKDSLRREALETRRKLEVEHAVRRSGDIDIKFGPGGLMDIYFATRYLSLLKGGSADPAAYSTAAKLSEFVRREVISAQVFDSLSGGHAFLSELDHNVRLLIGRSSRLPKTDPDLLGKIAKRMALPNLKSLDEQLSVHRMNIRSAFEEILSD